MLSLQPRSFPLISLSLVFAHSRLAQHCQDGVTVQLKVETPREMLCENSDGSVAAPLRERTMIFPLPAAVLTPYLAFALCMAIYLLPFMRLVIIGSDEGSLVGGAVRILHGQVFARDFFEVMGPGTFYWLAAMFKLFGATFLVARIWLFITSLGTLLSMYFLSRRICTGYQIIPPILLVSVYFSTMWPMVNHHVDSNFFALLSVVCIVLWQDLRKSYLLLAAGSLAGVTTCILQPKGLFLLLAFCVWLLVQIRRRPELSSALIIVVGGYLCVVGPTLFYFWSRGAFSELIYMNFIWPMHHYGAVNAIPYARGIALFWNHWALPIHGVRWLIPLAVILILPFALVVALPVLVPILSIPIGKNNLSPVILLYWVCGWALWLSEIHRRDIAHLISGSPLLIVLCIHFLLEYRVKVAMLALQFLAISALGLATVNLFIVLSAKSFPTRAGTIAMFKQNSAIEFLDNHVPPGTEIFVYPASPMYYFLTTTTNPTPYSLLLYNYNTPSQFRDVIRVLDERKVRYVLWDTSFELTAAPYFSSEMYHPAGGFLMEPYLESHYKVVKDIDGARIMELNEDDRTAKR